jgi:hypothetical protein
MFEFQRAGLAINGQVVPVLEFGQLLSDFFFGFFAFGDVKFKGTIFFAGDLSFFFMLIPHEVKTHKPLESVHNINSHEYYTT